MHEFLLKILPIVIIIGITLAVAPGRRKEKKLGYIHTYDTYGKMFLRHNPTHGADLQYSVRFGGYIGHAQRGRNWLAVFTSSARPNKHVLCYFRLSVTVGATYLVACSLR